MNILCAMRALQEGHLIKREIWGNQYHLTLDESGTINMMPTVPPTHFTFKVYVFTLEDIQATDWLKVSTKKYVVYKDTHTPVTNPSTLTQAKEDKQRLFDEHEYTPPKGKGTTTFKIQEVQEE